MTDKRCCTGDCNQGRDCPHKENALSVGNVTFTVVMSIITLLVAVSFCWWLITAVLIIVEAFI
jgi:hypothetical protein